MRSPILLAAGCLILAGCGGGAFPPAGNDTRPSATLAGGSTVLPMPASAGPTRDAAGRAVDAPADAAYTIFCREFDDARHHDTATAALARAADATGLDDFYLVRGDGHSVLYHGFYRAMDDSIDPRSAEAAREHRETISRVTLNGRPFFPQAHVAQLQRPDPAAPAEWDAAGLDAFWTVVIGVYTDPVRAKEAAVQSVRAAREMGVDAYYLHHEGMSYVCVGGWPADAVRRQMSLQDRDQAGAGLGIDENDPAPIVVSNGPVPPEYRNLRDARGRPVRVLETTPEILDPTLQETIDAYPYSVDGEPRREVPLLLKLPELTGRAYATPEETPAGGRNIENLLDRPDF